MKIISRIKDTFIKPPPKEVGKKRLQLILKYDRAGLPPNAINEVKEAILRALKDFPFIDVEGINIYIPTDNSEEKIEIEVPVKNNR
jgi:cell division topological specificity factor